MVSFHSHTVFVLQRYELFLNLTCRFKKKLYICIVFAKNLKFEMIMKTKKRNYIFLAVLMMGIATMMTGCVKEDIASNSRYSYSGNEFL